MLRSHGVGVPSKTCGVTIILVLLTVSAREQWAADHIGKEVMRCVGELEP